jgi:hypothetical protein
MIKITLPIDFFLNIGITKNYNLITSMLSQQLSKRHGESIMVELGDSITISGTSNIEDLQLILTDIQCSAIRFRNTMIDVREKNSKPIMKLLVGISEREVVDDMSLLYIMCFTVSQVIYYTKTPLESIYKTIDELYGQTVVYHDK